MRFDDERECVRRQSMVFRSTDLDWRLGLVVLHGYGDLGTIVPRRIIIVTATGLEGGGGLLGLRRTGSGSTTFQLRHVDLVLFVRENVEGFVFANDTNRNVLRNKLNNFKILFLAVSL